MLLRNQKGFTLIELLTALAIIAILVLASYPLYSQHILKTRRSDAEIALLNLAGAMESYYSLNNTYEGANLAIIGVNAYTQNAYYLLSISSTTADNYTLRAIPQGTQAKDTTCGTLTLTQTGEKWLSGVGSIEDCW